MVLMWFTISLDVSYNSDIIIVRDILWMIDLGDTLLVTDNKKEKEREELHRAIWAIADELRGAVDGWDFKNYVLGAMFYRYISENLTNYVIFIINTK